MKFQQGLSLIEMLVALTVSMVLMSGVLAIMSTTKKTSALQEELSRLQEDARFLMEDLSYNVRMAGYFGCSGIIRGNFNRPNSISVENNKQIRDANDKAISKSTPYSDVLTISHFAANGKLQLNYPAAQEIANTRTYLATADCDDLTAPPPADGSPSPKQGEDLPAWCQSNSVTDINLCQQVISEKNYIKTQQCAGDGFTTENLHVDLDPNGTLPTKTSVIVIADCSGADFYQVAEVRGGSQVVVMPLDSTCRNRLCRKYFWPIDVFHLPEIEGKSTLEERTQVTYQVKAIDKDGDGNANGAIDGFALFKDNELFIEGVQSLQVRYGIDTNSDNIVDRYVEATTTPIAPIISVRINILMRTANKRFDLTGSTNRNFKLDPDLPEFNPDDNKNLKNEEGYRHRLLTTTIRVRNS